MNNRGTRIPRGEAPVVESAKLPRRRTGNGTRPRAFLGDTTREMACGVCNVTFHLGHRGARFPCGRGRHVLNARCKVKALAKVQHRHHSGAQ